MGQIFANEEFRKALLLMASACVVAVLLVPVGIRLAWRLDIVDRPRGNKIHARATPLMGGVAIAVSFLAVALLWAYRSGQWQAGQAFNRPLLGLLIGCALAAALGFVDEKFSLPPRWHFGGQLAVVAGALLAGFEPIRKISNPFHTTAADSPQHSGSVWLSHLLGFANTVHDPAPAITAILGIVLTVFWIVGMMNTMNFLDGLDGLAGGVAAIAAFFLGLWSIVMTDMGYAPTRGHQNVVLPLVLCGAILGFLVFNWSPARVFMGDSGAMFIGFALGALSIFGPVKLGTGLLLLIIPIVDVAWAIVRRIIGGQSFATGDKHHIYHRMLELGMGRRSVVLSFYVLCIGLGVIDLNVFKTGKVVADLLVAVLVAVGAVALEVRGRRVAAHAARGRADAQS